MKRRRVLALGGLSLAAGLAGCSEDGSSGDANPEDGGDGGNDGPIDASPTPTATPTPTPTPTPTATDATPGTTGDCTVSNALDGAPAVPVTVDGRFADAAAVLDLRWNVRSQRSVKESPDAVVGYRADDDHTMLVFRFEVHNPTDDVVTVDRHNFVLEYLTPDIVETVGPSINGMDEINYSIRSGGTVDGFLTFSVRADATEATLRPTEANFADRVRVAFDPNCDESLAVGLPPMESE